MLVLRGRDRAQLKKANFVLYSGFLMVPLLVESRNKISLDSSFLRLLQIPSWSVSGTKSRKQAYEWLTSYQKNSRMQTCPMAVRGICRSPTSRRLWLTMTCLWWTLTWGTSELRPSFIQISKATSMWSTRTCLIHWGPEIRHKAISIWSIRWSHGSRPGSEVTFKGSNTWKCRILSSGKLVRPWAKSPKRVSDGVMKPLPTIDRENQVERH